MSLSLSVQLFYLFFFYFFEVSKCQRCVALLREMSHVWTFNGSFMHQYTIKLVVLGVSYVLSCCHRLWKVTQKYCRRAFCVVVLEGRKTLTNSLRLYRKPEIRTPSFAGPTCTVRWYCVFPVNNFKLPARINTDFIFKSDMETLIFSQNFSGDQFGHPWRVRWCFHDACADQEHISAQCCNQIPYKWT